MSAGPTNRGLPHHQSGRDKNTFWGVLWFGREFEGKFAGYPPQLRRSMVNRTQWDSQVVRVTKVATTDECNVFGDS